jgi:hypothetical protein
MPTHSKTVKIDLLKEIKEKIIHQRDSSDLHCEAISALDHLIDMIDKDIKEIRWIKPLR